MPARAYGVPRGESWEDVNKRARRLLLRLGGTFVSGKGRRDDDKKAPERFPRMPGQWLPPLKQTLGWIISTQHGQLLRVVEMLNKTEWDTLVRARKTRATPPGGYKQAEEARAFIKEVEVKFDALKKGSWITVGNDPGATRKKTSKTRTTISTPTG